METSPRPTAVSRTIHNHNDNHHSSKDRKNPISPFDSVPTEDSGVPTDLRFVTTHPGFGDPTDLRRRPFAVIRRGPCHPRITPLPSDITRNRPFAADSAVEEAVAADSFADGVAEVGVAAEAVAVFPTDPFLPGNRPFLTIASDAVPCGDDRPFAEHAEDEDHHAGEHPPCRKTCDPMDPCRPYGVPDFNAVSVIPVEDLLILLLP